MGFKQRFSTQHSLFFSHRLYLHFVNVGGQETPTCWVSHGIPGSQVSPPTLLRRPQRRREAGIPKNDGGG